MVPVEADIHFECRKCGKKLKSVPEVLVFPKEEWDYMPFLIESCQCEPRKETKKWYLKTLEE